MIALSYRLDRTVVIRARRDTVFRFLSNAAEWAEWWGAGSTIDARPGGAKHGAQLRIVDAAAVAAGEDAVGHVRLEAVPAARRIAAFALDHRALTRLEERAALAQSLVDDLLEP